MAFDRFTIGERLEAQACHEQELAAHAHYWACTALAAGQRDVAAAWQREQAQAADRAAGDVTRLTKAPKEWLELEA